MRHLSKIIFFNSANIPFAEVMLDGNVYFSGTQGVGKSTVLRALLFFYNADKTHLGIQPGQKSFEEFYFRYSNSYIVYEVKTDHSFYSIIVSRTQGKATYRFVDAPYQKEWFMDSSGRVESDWIRIREHIGAGVDITPKIDTYDLYRNIIFGNTHDRSHRYDKFALVESQKYQNIPRSIQNVFLNSKLDADFVKNTIIQSMTDSEDDISLGSYRSLVANFEREFDEIDCWYRRDKNGDIPVRTKANKVIETYRLLVALEYEMRQTWHELNHATARDKEQLPLLEERISEQKQKLEKIAQKIEALQQEYEKAHEVFIKEIAKQEQRLNDIREKRKYYEQLGIQSLIAHVAKEPALLREKEQTEQTLRVLKEQYRDVTEKYKAIYEQLKKELEGFVFSQKEELQRLSSKRLAGQDQQQQLREKRRKAIDAAYAEWTSNSDERLSALQEECNRTDKRLSELRFWHPLQKDTEAAEESIRALKAEQKDVEVEMKVLDSDINAVRQEGIQKQELAKASTQQKQDAVSGQLEQLRTELASVESKLSRWDGSLYEWLTKNRPGWEDNIGKVVDEQEVLYAQGLNPSLVDADGDTLYGVRIDVDKLGAHHRSPDEYRAIKGQLEETIAAKEKEAQQLAEQLQKELDGISRSCAKHLGELQQQMTTLRVRFEQIPLKLRDEDTRLRQLRQQEQGLIDEEQKKRSAAYNEAQLKLEKEKTQRKNEAAKHEKELKASDATYRSALKSLQEEFDAFKARQETDLKEKQKDIEARRKEAEKQEHDELSGKGADTQAIEKCNQEIERIRLELEQIVKERKHVNEYEKDDRELFQHEAEFKEQKRSCESQDAQLRATYQDKRRKQETEQAALKSELHLVEQQVEKKNDGLKQYDQMCQVENILPDALLQDDVQKKTEKECLDLVADMRGVVNRKRQKMEELKRSVNAFNTHFTQNNTFHFIVPQYDDDYLAFALNLQEFIDDNRIETFRSRVSEQYNNILRSVSREVGLLMNHSAEIRAVIGEVNRNFEQRNFAGVIRKIELRAEESSDRMMSLLRSIRDFTVENAMQIGELNLFSNNEHDKVNDKVVEYLKRFMDQLQKEPARTSLTLQDTFRLQFRIQENDNDTGWVERISNVGSDGTDILVKAMVNIMLIDVFKQKASRRSGDFIIHCMMDEIGKLHPSNVRGILQFANVRNIYLINSSPMGYNNNLYRHNYLLTKDGKSQTHIKRLETTIFV